MLRVRRRGPYEVVTMTTGDDAQAVITSFGCLLFVLVIIIWFSI